MEPDPPAAPVTGKRRSVLGVTAVGIALAAAVLLALAMGNAVAQAWQLATALAYVTIALTVLAFLAGLVAVIANLGRRSGVAAMVLAVAANPLVLIFILRLLA
ncbi:MAG: hypothetical protein JWP30_1618 [Homoserinimonas sp.]|jgi:hypothetical protein|nr:hypothetical protein [Homoserinimonas sp.]